MDTSRIIQFHLDKDILPIEEMRTCVSEIIDLVKSASEDCLADITWFAEIQRGSVALALYPSSETETNEDIDRFLGDFRSDLTLIEKGKPPKVISGKTLSHYAKVADLFHNDETVRPTLTVVSPSAPLEPPIEMASYKVQLKETRTYQAFGTAYGEVKSLFSNGRPSLALYDESTGKRIKVFYNDDLLDAVRESYRNTVRISGDITYNADGTKRFIEAEEIAVVNGKQEGRFSDLFGILGGV